ncbi:hypothetical protein [Nocardia sp. X0981]
MSSGFTVTAPVPDHVRDGVREAGWPGIVLPLTKVSDHTVFPVITIDPDVWFDRISHGQGPELDRSTLAIWEAWTNDLGAPPPRPPVSIVGFVSTATTPTPALDALDAIAGYGAGLWVSTGTRRPTTLTLTAFDLADIWVVHSQPTGAGVLVRGRRGPIAGAHRMTALRHKEELLFHRALTSIVTHPRLPLGTEK